MSIFFTFRAGYRTVLKTPHDTIPGKLVQGAAAGAIAAAVLAALVIFASLVNIRFMFVAAHPQGVQGVHRYRPEEYGLDVPRERERFHRYTERFGIEPEAQGTQAGALRDL